MTDAIGPGDWIECIESLTDHTGSVTAGNHYQVRKFGNRDAPCHRSGCYGQGLILVGDRDQVQGWCNALFRPMRRNTDFTSLLTTTPTEA